MNVLGDDPATTDVKEGCYPGETVSFKVASAFADQTAEWESGTQALNLTATRLFPDISIQKQINGQDADTSPGPYLMAGDDLTWSYTVNNSGETPLIDITVTDDNGTPLDTSDDFIVCDPFDLAVGEDNTCFVFSSAQSGPYVNIAKATGYDPEDLPVSATDQAHYFGVAPDTSLVKLTNDQDVDIVEEIYVESDGTVNWTYVVENTGNVELTGVTVTDDQGVTVTCPKDVLAPGELMTCTASDDAIAGQYQNTGSVVGVPPVGDPVGDEDLSHYFGSAPGIVIVKKANGGVYTSAAPLYILVGDPITWTYEVENTGNVDLMNVAVVDDLGTDGTPQEICTIETLEAGAKDTTSCFLSGTAVEGQYHNTATVTGTPPVGSDVTASADSYYFGSTPDVALEYSVNGNPADTTPLYVQLPATLNLEYKVTNTGNVPLFNLVVTDGSYTCNIASLPVGEFDTSCTGQIMALSGQQSATASVTANPPEPLLPENDTDPMNYFGAILGLSLDKKTNGEQAEEIPGVYVLTGSTVNWTYDVTNTGNVTLTDVTVVDDQGVTVDCPANSLAFGGSMTCTASDTAQEGQYTNTATVTGSPPDPLLPLDASDTSHYFGTTLDVTLEKFTNGEVANTGTGPLIGVGEPVNWTYVVTNNSNVAIDFAISDTPAPASGISCDKYTLSAKVGDVVDSVTCEASGTAIAGQNENTATVTVTPPGGLATFDVQDTSHYFGVTTGIDIEKHTQGQDADTPTGPLIKIGTTVEWDYYITNMSNVILTNVTVMDDNGTPVNTDDDYVVCDGITLQPYLEPGYTHTCSDSSELAVAGQYVNVATVTGNPPIGFDTVDDFDPSHYFGSDAGVELTKLTNGVDTGLYDPPYILVGDPVEWTYLVENIGNLNISNIIVTEDVDESLTILCDETVLVDGQLLPGDTMSCTANGEAIKGSYQNTATVEGTPFGFETEIVSDSDTSAYFGADPSIDIEKSTEGVDADDPPGPYIPVGTGETPVEFNYQISNLEVDYAFTDIQVVDDRGTPDDPGDDLSVNCPETTLAPGQSMSCDPLTNFVETGQVASAAHVFSSAWVDGDEPQLLGEVSNSDPAYYFGYTLGLKLTKFTNGKDVDPPGLDLPIDSAVTWTYELENTGNVELGQVSVEDDNGTDDPGDDLTVDNGEITCDGETIPGGESMICTASGTVIEGEYTNHARAAALFNKDSLAGDQWLEDHDVSYYVGRTGYKIFLPMLLR